MDLTLNPHIKYFKTSKKLVAKLNILVNILNTIPLTNHRGFLGVPKKSAVK